MPLVNERHIIDNENAGFADRPQILDDPLGADQPIAATVKGPGAAERTIPRAAAREFDRRARVEGADEIFAAVSQQIARRGQLIKRMNKDGRRPFALGGDNPRHRQQVAPARHRFEQQRHCRFALTLEHAIDRAIAMGDDRGGGERCAVPADTDEHIGKARFGGLGQIDDFRDIGEVVAGERDDIRAAPCEPAEIGAVVLDLEIDQLDLMAGAPRRLRDELKAQRLQSQKDLRVHQWARMNAQQPHRIFSPCLAAPHIAPWFGPEASRDAVLGAGRATHASQASCIESPG